MIPKPYSPETLADRWGCSAEKIRGMCRTGELASFRLGKLIRIPAAEVERYECQDTEALNAFANSKAVKLAELQSKRPELHTECVHALDNKRAAMNFTPEGRPETDMGEGFNDDTANWEE